MSVCFLGAAKEAKDSPIVGLTIDEFVTKNQQEKDLILSALAKGSLAFDDNQNIVSGRYDTVHEGVTYSFDNTGSGYLQRALFEIGASGNKKKILEFKAALNLDKDVNEILDMGRKVFNKTTSDYQKSISVYGKAVGLAKDVIDSIRTKKGAVKSMVTKTDEEKASYFEADSVNPELNELLYPTPPKGKSYIRTVIDSILEKKEKPEEEEAVQPVVEGTSVARTFEANTPTVPREAPTGPIRLEDVSDATHTFKPSTSESLAGATEFVGKFASEVETGDKRSKAPVLFRFNPETERWQFSRNGKDFAYVPDFEGQVNSGEILVGSRISRFSNLETPEVDGILAEAGLTETATLDADAYQRNLAAGGDTEVNLDGKTTGKSKNFQENSEAHWQEGADSTFHTNGKLFDWVRALDLALSGKAQALSGFDKDGKAIVLNEDVYAQIRDEDGLADADRLHFANRLAHNIARVGTDSENGLSPSFISTWNAMDTATKDAVKSFLVKVSGEGSWETLSGMSPSTVAAEMVQRTNARVTSQDTSTAFNETLSNPFLLVRHRPSRAAVIPEVLKHEVAHVELIRLTGLAENVKKVFASVIESDDYKALTNLMKGEGSLYQDEADSPFQVIQETLAHGVDGTSLEFLGVKTDEDKKVFHRLYDSIIDTLAKRATSLEELDAIENLIRNFDETIGKKYDKFTEERNRLQKIAGGYPTEAEGGPRGISEDTSEAVRVGQQLGNTGQSSRRTIARGTGVKLFSPEAKLGLKIGPEGKSRELFMEGQDGRLPADSVEIPLAEANLLDLATDVDAKRIYENSGPEAFKEWAAKRGYHGFFDSDLNETADMHRASLFDTEEVNTLLGETDFDVTLYSRRRPADNLVFSPEREAEVVSAIQTGTGLYRLSNSTTGGDVSDWLPGAAPKVVFDAADPAFLHMNDSMFRSLLDVVDGDGAGQATASLFGGFTFHSQEKVGAIFGVSLYQHEQMNSPLYQRLRGNWGDYIALAERLTGLSYDKMPYIKSEDIDSLSEYGTPMSVVYHDLSRGFAEVANNKYHEGTHLLFDREVGPHILSGMNKRGAGSPLASVSYDNLKKLMSTSGYRDIVNSPYKVINEVVAGMTRLDSLGNMGVDLFDDNHVNSVLDVYMKTIKTISDDLGKPTAESIARYFDPKVGDTLGKLYEGINADRLFFGAARRDEVQGTAAGRVPADIAGTGKGGETLSSRRRIPSPENVTTEELRNLYNRASSYLSRAAMDGGVREPSTTIHINGVRWSESNAPKSVKAEFGALLGQDYTTGKDAAAKIETNLKTKIDRHEKSILKAKSNEADLSAFAEIIEVEPNVWQIVNKSGLSKLREVDGLKTDSFEAAQYELNNAYVKHLGDQIAEARAGLDWIAKGFEYTDNRGSITHKSPRQPEHINMPVTLSSRRRIADSYGPGLLKVAKVQGMSDTPGSGRLVRLKSGREDLTSRMGGVSPQFVYLAGLPVKGKANKNALGEVFTENFEKISRETGMPMSVVKNMVDTISDNVMLSQKELITLMAGRAKDLEVLAERMLNNAKSDLENFTYRPGMPRFKQPGKNYQYEMPPVPKDEAEAREWHRNVNEYNVRQRETELARIREIIDWTSKANPDDLALDYVMPPSETALTNKELYIETVESVQSSMNNLAAAEAQRKAQAAFDKSMVDVTPVLGAKGAKKAVPFAEIVKRPPIDITAKVTSTVRQFEGPIRIYNSATEEIHNYDRFAGMSPEEITKQKRYEASVSRFKENIKNWAEGKGSQSGNHLQFGTRGDGDTLIHFLTSIVGLRNVPERALGVKPWHTPEERANILDFSRNAFGRGYLEMLEAVRKNNENIDQYIEKAVDNYAEWYLANHYQNDTALDASIMKRQADNKATARAKVNPETVQFDNEGNILSSRRRIASPEFTDDEGFTSKALLVIHGLDINNPDKPPATLPPSSTGQQWAKFLLNKGIRQAELDVMGLDTYLAENGNKQIPLQTLREEIARRRMSIETVRYGGRHRGVSEADQMFATGLEPLYDREGLRTPGPSSRYIEMVIRTNSLARGRMNQNWSKQDLPPYMTVVKMKDGTFKLAKKNVYMPMEPMDRAFIKTRPLSGITFESEADAVSYFMNLHMPTFKDTHWRGVSNVLAHWRGDERVLPTGEKATLIDEVQSTSHQQNRKRFGAPVNDEFVKEIQRIDTELMQLETSIYEDIIANPDIPIDRAPSYTNVSDIDRLEGLIPFAESIQRQFMEDPTRRTAWRGAQGTPTTLFSYANLYPEQFLEFAKPFVDKLHAARMLDKARKSVLNAYDFAMNSDKGNLPVDAPFANDWPDVTVKTALRYAIENGSQYLLWTPGETQAARYNLSTQFDELKFVKMQDPQNLPVSEVKRIMEPMQQRAAELAARQEELLAIKDKNPEALREYYNNFEELLTLKQGLRLRELDLKQSESGIKVKLEIIKEGRNRKDYFGYIDSEDMVVPLYGDMYLPNGKLVTLETLFGDKVAETIRNSAENEMSLKGDQLAVKDDIYKYLYGSGDNKGRIGNFLSKYLKKYGVAVEELELPNSRRMEIFGRVVDMPEPPTKVYGVKITPEMAADIGQFQPLFSRRKMGRDAAEIEAIRNKALTDAGLQQQFRDAEARTQTSVDEASYLATLRTGTIETVEHLRELADKDVLFVGSGALGDKTPEENMVRTASLRDEAYLYIKRALDASGQWYNPDTGIVEKEPSILMYGHNNDKNIETTLASIFAMDQAEAFMIREGVPMLVRKDGMVKIGSDLTMQEVAPNFVMSEGGGTVVTLENGKTVLIKAMFDGDWTNPEKPLDLNRGAEQVAIRKEFKTELGIVKLLKQVRSYVDGDDMDLPLDSMPMYYMGKVVGHATVDMDPTSPTKGKWVGTITNEDGFTGTSWRPSKGQIVFSSNGIYGGGNKQLDATKMLTIYHDTPKPRTRVQAVVMAQELANQLLWKGKMPKLKPLPPKPKTTSREVLAKYEAEVEKVNSENRKIRAEKAEMVIQFLVNSALEHYGKNPGYLRKSRLPVASVSEVAKVLGYSNAEMDSFLGDVVTRLSLALTSGGSTTALNLEMAINWSHKLFEALHSGTLTEGFEMQRARTPEELQKAQENMRGNRKASAVYQYFGTGTDSVQKHAMMMAGYVPADSPEGKLLVKVYGEDAIVSPSEVLQNYSTMKTAKREYIFSFKLNEQNAAHGPFIGSLKYALMSDTVAGKGTNSEGIFGPKLGPYLSEIFGRVNQLVADVHNNTLTMALMGEAVTIENVGGKMVAKDRSSKVGKLGEKFNEEDLALVRGIWETAAERLRARYPEAQDVSTSVIKDIVWPPWRELFNILMGGPSPEALYQSLVLSSGISMKNAKIDAELVTKYDKFKALNELKGMQKPDITAEAMGNANTDYVSEILSSRRRPPSDPETMASRRKTRQIDMSEQGLLNGDVDAWVEVATRFVSNGQHPGQLADSEIQAIRLLAEKGDIESLRKYVLNLNRQAPLELLVNLGRLSLLLGVKTIAKNLLGNSLRQFMDEVSRVPASVIDLAFISMNKAIGGQNLKRSTTSLLTNPLGTLRAYKEALTGAVGKGGVEFIKTLTGDQENVQFEHPSLLRERTTGWRILKPFEWLERLGWRFQGALDRPFNVAAFDRTLSELQMMRMNEEHAAGNKITYDEAEQYLTVMDYQLAEQYALEATYQKSNPIASRYYNLVDGLPPTWRAIITNVNKFVKTPLNVVDYVMDYTGIWQMAKLAHREYNTPDWVNWKNTLKKVLDTPQDRKVMSMAITQGAIGNLMLYIGYQLAAKGLLTQFFDREDKKEAEQMEAKGTSYGQVTIAGRSVDISWLSPNGYWLIAGATAYNTSKDYELKLEQLNEKRQAAVEEQDNDRVERIDQEIADHKKNSPTDEMLTRIIKNLALQTPFLKPIDDIVSSYNQNRLFEGLAERWISPEVYVPALFKEVAATKDDFTRVVDDSSILAKFRDKVQMNIPSLPGLSGAGQSLQETGIPGVTGFGKILQGREALPVRVDMLGRPMEAPFGLDPTRSKAVSTDPLTLELDKYNITITEPKGGSTVEVNKLMREKGEFFRTYLTPIISQSDYVKADDKTKQRILESATRLISRENTQPKLNKDELAYNLKLLTARESFRTRVISNPSEFIKPTTLTDKELIKIFVGADLPPTISINQIIRDVREKKDFQKFINDKFLYELMVSDKVRLGEAQANYNAFLADPQLALIRWWAEDRRYAYSRDRNADRREALQNEGKSKEEIEKILRKESNERGARTRQRLKTVTGITVTK